MDLVSFPLITLKFTIPSLRYSYNMGRLMNNNYVIAPCTPTGIIELLKYHEFPLKGKDVLIINRSEMNHGS